MTLRPLCFWLGLACLGCQSLAPLVPPPDAESAVQLWQQGQDAMRRGQPKQAVLLYERSLAADPAMLRNHLSLAAAYLELGAEPTACNHLCCYVQAHPEHLSVRVHLADLQLRLHRLADARAEFARCIACAQDQSEQQSGTLIHCHARLMQIAEEQEDCYGEHLHRGIGLCLLARQRSRLPDPEGELSSESLLCKAAGELTLAHLDRPDEARPSWYLHQVWHELDQRQAALRCLHAAADAAPFSELTLAEKRALQLKCVCQTAEQPVK
jgi:tetratricopeptide (TPR) repeat protein